MKLSLTESLLSAYDLVLVPDVLHGRFSLILFSTSLFFIGFALDFLIYT